MLYNIILVKSRVVSLSDLRSLRSYLESGTNQRIPPAESLTRFPADQGSGNIPRRSNHTSVIRQGFAAGKNPERTHEAKKKYLPIRRILSDDNLEREMAPEQAKESIDEMSCYRSKPPLRRDLA
jgi:hypothetical protein